MLSEDRPIPTYAVYPNVFDICSMVDLVYCVESSWEHSNPEEIYDQFVTNGSLEDATQRILQLEIQCNKYGYHRLFTSQSTNMIQ